MKEEIKIMKKSDTEPATIEKSSEDEICTRIKNMKNKEENKKSRNVTLRAPGTGPANKNAIQIIKIF